MPASEQKYTVREEMALERLGEPVTGTLTLGDATALQTQHPMQLPCS